jgi:hypothetical protein
LFLKRLGRSSHPITRIRKIATYSDLSLYEYFPEDTVGSPLNVGWLGPDMVYETGAVSTQVINQLEKLTLFSIQQTRGYHFCHLCSECDENFVCYHNIHGKSYLLGSAELRVFGDSGKIYASPDLLLHYIIGHNYLPPQEFLDAVVETPCPPASEFFKCLDDTGLDYDENRSRKWDRSRNE